jgi:DNA invertase Pin-like site-specific DNA recombinase
VFKCFWNERSSRSGIRTKAALVVKKERGESTGTPPYGWRLGDDGRTLVPDETEQETVRRMRELRAAGWSYRRIRLEGALLGLASRTGKAFTPAGGVHYDQVCSCNVRIAR